MHDTGQADKSPRRCDSVLLKKDAILDHDRFSKTTATHRATADTNLNRHPIDASTRPMKARHTNLNCHGMRPSYFESIVVKKQLRQSHTRVWCAHKSLADQKGVDARVTHPLHITALQNTAFGNENFVFRNFFHQRQRGI